MLMEWMRKLSLSELVYFSKGVLSNKRCEVFSTIPVSAFAAKATWVLWDHSCLGRGVERMPGPCAAPLLCFLPQLRPCALHQDLLWMGVDASWPQREGGRAPVRESSTVMDWHFIVLLFGEVWKVSTCIMVTIGFSMPLPSFAISLEVSHSIWSVLLR